MGIGELNRAVGRRVKNVSLSDRKRTMEKLWRELFSDPSEWWDHRSDKVNWKYPDFKHKKTRQGLWVIDDSNPSWVKTELAALTPGILQSNIVSWNKRLAKYVKDREYRKTFELFQQMQQEGMNLNKFTFIPVLKACCSLQALKQGKHIHLHIIQTGHESDVHISTCLVDMYAKCGSIEDAWEVFSKMPVRDVVSWTSLIMGYVKCGQGQRALELFEEMQLQGVRLDHLTFVGVVNACASLGALQEGKHVHELIVRSGFESDVFVGSSLINMYAKCGCIEDAWRVFNKMPARDVVAWSAMIMGSEKCGQGQRALDLFHKMQCEGVEPDCVTFVGVLNACASLGAIQEGWRIHKQIMRSGYERDVFVGSCLVDMYAKCGSIEDAWGVFWKMPKRNVVSWTAMIIGLVKCGQGQKALELYRQMQVEEVDPNPFTFVGVLNACASLEALEEGRCVHERIIQTGYESNVFVGSSLIDMYGKCGSIEDASTVFNKMQGRDVVAWGSMILAYVKCGQGHQALKLFQKMQMEGVDTDPALFVGLLNACSSEVALEEGRRIHGHIIRRGFESDVFVGSCLVDMYAKCGAIEDAWKVFYKLPVHDVVSWNAMLAGYSMHGYVTEAMRHVEQMSQAGIQINGITLVSVLSACSHAGLVDEGLHYLETMSAVHNISATEDHYACLVDLLGRAGRLHEAEDFIKRMVPSQTNTSAWMSLLGACKVHGNVEMGEHVAKQVVELDPEHAGGYLLLSNLYAADGNGIAATVERDVEKEGEGIPGQV